jgi:dihydroorotate dehydrogenase (NAD+) catalytic subunit
MAPSEALAFFFAGASAIQVGTAIFVQPTMLIRLIDDLHLWMEHQGVRALDEIVGAALPASVRQRKQELDPEIAVAAG